eukprot:2303082-Rhodomonas_salina.5
MHEVRAPARLARARPRRCYTRRLLLVLASSSSKSPWPTTMYVHDDYDHDRIPNELPSRDCTNHFKLEIGNPGPLPVLVVEPVMKGGRS